MTGWYIFIFQSSTSSSLLWYNFLDTNANQPLQLHPVLYSIIFVPLGCSWSDLFPLMFIPISSLSPMLSSRSFIVLALTLRSLIQFWVNFCRWWKVRVQHHSFACGYLVFLGFPGGISDKEPTCRCRRHKRRGFNPWMEYSCLENPHGPEEPGRLQSKGLQRTRHEWVTKHTI